VTSFDPETDVADGLKSILNTVKHDVTNGFDLLEYAVPYFWGNVGILYNTEVVDEADLIGWDVLHNNEYKIAFYNSARDAFMPALKATGASTINHPTATEMDEAVQWLSEGLTSEVSVITDEIFDAMLDPARYDLAVSYSGDANYLMSENDTLGFFVPEEGTNVWMDGFVIPEGANEDLSYAFINFMMTYEHALQNTEYVGYSTPRQDVFEDVLASGGSFEDYADSYDVRINAFDEVYRYNETLKDEMDTKWQEILANKGFDEDEGLVAGAMIAIIGIGIIKKKRSVI